MMARSPRLPNTGRPSTQGPLMSRPAVRALLVGALTAMALVDLAGCRGTYSEETPFHPNWNMDDQNRYNPQEDNPDFADGMANRPLVPGTVARGTLKADDHLWRGTTGGESGGSEPTFATALPAKRSDGSPMVLDKAFLKRGQERFAIFCVPCHDGAGTGNGTAVQRGVLRPPSFYSEPVLAHPVGKLFDIVTHGVRNMSGYGKQIPVDDRWAIAAYVRTLQRSHYAQK